MEHFLVNRSACFISVFPLLTGSSDGLYYDEYLQQEQDDACEIIAWLAAQSWCSGAVGMYGKSWGGFNGLQVLYFSDLF